MSHKINMKFEYNSDMIKLTTSNNLLGTMMDQKMVEYINLREDGVRKALTALGWTPPPASTNSG